jgi:cell division protein ZapE
MMNPLNYYLKQVSEGVIVADDQQLELMRALQKTHHDLLLEHKKRAKLSLILRKPQVVSGHYIWGGVGIGKTFLMDCFYHCIPFQEKMRIHFHAFMKMVHHELKKHQGEKNPLQIIAKKIAKKHMLICFDEFFVADIVDAMLLARLLEALFSNGVCLVTTSNVEPDELYKRGLQRPLFLPAIALIKQHTTVTHVSTIVDYRLRYLKMAGVYYTPNNAHAKEQMEKSFSILSKNQEQHHLPIVVCERPIKIKKQSGDVVWFDFKAICKPPRSQQDYLAIAEKYKTIFISNVPVIPPEANDIICLFIRMVDVFYDAHIRLVVSSEVKVDEIYTQGTMAFEFARTRSRLFEMQSESYFSSL